MSSGRSAAASAAISATLATTMRIAASTGPSADRAWTSRIVAPWRRADADAQSSDDDDQSTDD
jgi:hypothetical protein